MPVDFKANQIRTSQIIASGSNSSNASIVVYNVSSATNDEGGYSPSLSTSVGRDTFIFVSGSINSKKTTTKGTALFGGDVVVSGSVVVERGLSGSLTQLWDGRSYLVAGTNVTINSSSNGQVVISSTGGSSSAAGSAGSVQFNDGSGNFDADPNFSYNNTLDILSTPKLSVTTQFEVSGTTYIGDATGNDYLYVNSALKTDIIPDTDRSVSLGSSAKRFANVYTGDLHLRNDRGNWTIVEEEDFLCVINNLTGKKYKMMLEPLD